MAGLVVANKAPPSCHPAEGRLDEGASRQNIEPRLAFDASDGFDDEIKIGGLVHELAPVPRPTVEGWTSNRRVGLGRTR
ncbi:hypothetical protein ACVJBD_000778 [Rhizobium mongolense]